MTLSCKWWLNKVLHRGGCCLTPCFPYQSYIWAEGYWGSTAPPPYVQLLLLPQKLFNILPSLLSQYAITKIVWDQNLFVKFGYVNVFIIPWCWFWWVLGCRSNWQILLLRKCATRAWYPDILRRCAVRLAFCQGRRPHDCFVLPTRPPTGFAHTGRPYTS